MSKDLQKILSEQMAQRTGKSSTKSSVATKESKTTNPISRRRGRPAKKYKESNHNLITTKLKRLSDVSNYWAKKGLSRKPSGVSVINKYISSIGDVQLTAITHSSLCGFLSLLRTSGLKDTTAREYIRQMKNFLIHTAEQPDATIDSIKDVTEVFEASLRSWKPLKGTSSHSSAKKSILSRIKSFFTK